VVYAANTSPDQIESYDVALEVGTTAASEITGTVATLNGTVNPRGAPVKECEFEYGTSSEYVATGKYEHTVKCEKPDAEELGSGTGDVPVHAKISGLLGGTTYHFRLVAEHENSEHETTTLPGEDEAFATPTVAVLSGEQADEVTAGGAQLKALLDPEGLPVTRCAFEYVQDDQYQAEAPDPYAKGRTVRCEQKLAQLGTGTEPVPVGAQLTELAPDTTYHWRLSVRDEHGTALSPDHTFVYSTVGPELPDHRAYEMVTPPFKNGALFGSVFEGAPPSVSQAGSRVIADTVQCFVPAESCTGFRGKEGEPFAFTRTDEAGQCEPAAPPCWKTTALAPPATRFRENTWWQFGADEADALFSMPAGAAGEDEWYARQPDGQFAPIGPATPPGATGVVKSNEVSPAATADLSHVVWEWSAKAGEDYLWPFDKATAEEQHNSLYEYAGTGNKEPFLVGVTGAIASTEQISTCGTAFGDRRDGGSETDALSADGRTVYFTADNRTNEKEKILHEPCPGGAGANEQIPVPVNELYARVDGEESGAHTVAISEPDAPQLSGESARGYASPPDENCTEEPCLKNVSDEKNWTDASFQNASEDGSKVLFSSAQQLTNAATQGANNLYLYDFDAPTGHKLIDVSAPGAGGEGGGGPQLQGVTALSADGSHVYFVAQGVLSSAPNKQGQSARSGRDNLYVYERDARYPQGHTTFIASLLAEDRHINKGHGATSAPDWSTEGESTNANVTPDGRFLVFESFGDLTPDTHSLGDLQVFRYDAASEELVRTSVGNDGFNDNGNVGAEAGIVQPVPKYLGPMRRDPTMSDDGSFVFFEDPAALTPHALNDVVIAHNDFGETFYAQNVYEWHAGHVYLISDGRDVSTAHMKPCEARAAVCLLGADATGHNVFFTTADQLVPRDTDTQVDIYDARICEPEHGNPCVTEPPPPLEPCGGESCHGIPEPTPSLLAPGTATFNGEGNVPTAPAVVKPKPKVVKCKTHFVKNAKGRCVKKKTKRAKKSSHGKRSH
jgi:hypothetical protein